MKLGQIFKPEGEDVSWEVVQVLDDTHCIIRKLFDTACVSDELYVG